MAAVSNVCPILHIETILGLFFEKMRLPCHNREVSIHTALSLQVTGWYGLRPPCDRAVGIETTLSLYINVM